MELWRSYPIWELNQRSSAIVAGALTVVVVMVCLWYAGDHPDPGQIIAKDWAFLRPINMLYVHPFGPNYWMERKRKTLERQGAVVKMDIRFGFLGIFRCKKWCHTPTLDPRHQRYRLCLKMGPSVHCRILLHIWLQGVKKQVRKVRVGGWVVCQWLPRKVWFNYHQLNR